MKKILLLLGIIVICSCTVDTEPGKGSGETIDKINPLGEAELTKEGVATLPAGQDNRTYKDLRGVWVVSLVNINWPIQGAAETAQKEKIIEILDHAKKLKFNSIFFQIKPDEGVIYPSKVAPPSVFLTGNPSDTYPYTTDMLEYAITEAHKRGLELHAWVNPFRVSVASTQDGSDTIYKDLTKGLVKKYKAAGHQLVKWGDNRWYVDPGVPMAQEHLLAIVDEVVKNYDVDGIHFDDYFYQYHAGSGVGYRGRTEWPDHAASSIITNLKDGSGKAFQVNGKTVFQMYKDQVPGNFTEDLNTNSDGYSTVDDGPAPNTPTTSGGLYAWRRAVINQFILNIKETIHSTKPYVEWSISPNAAWRNNVSTGTGNAYYAGDSQGSDTQYGAPNYDALSADVRLWMRDKKYVDIMIPQMYFTDHEPKAKYTALVNWWTKEAKGSEVDLVVGHALYRVGDRVFKPEGINVMNKQVKQYRDVTPKGLVKGSVFYGYGATTGTDGDTKGQGLQALRNVTNEYWFQQVLPPTTTTMKSQSQAPVKVPENVVVAKNGDKVVITWDDNNPSYVEGKAKPGDSFYHVVYTKYNGKWMSLEVKGRDSKEPTKGRFEYTSSKTGAQEFAVSFADRLGAETAATAVNATL